MLVKKNIILLIMMLTCAVLLYACSESGKRQEEVPENMEVLEKGYDLPVSDTERKEAEDDCKKMTALISDIYETADKGNASNVVLSDEILYEMAEIIGKTGSCVMTNQIYSNMENHETFEKFLNSCMAGESGSSVLYEIYSHGGLGRKKYIYDGKDMYVVTANMAWSDIEQPVITYISRARIKEWRYTDKGWLCYELCVPEYPEVTEILDGSYMIRVKPISEENRKMSEKCVLGLGYQGNNLLCSNWNTDSMERLDYNGLYEYLYAMKYERRFEPENDFGGIPKEEFEALVMEYLPIEPELIQKYAVFDEETQSYPWVSTGGFQYAPTFFDSSIPEVTNIRENADGTVTLTVDAVCEMILLDDAVITHELTVRFLEDGSFQYLGNRILNHGIEDIPEYKYRVISQTNYLL